MTNIYAQCLKKQKELKTIFHQNLSAEDRYIKIIAFGKTLEPYPIHLENEEHLVSGCQSITYLAGQLIEDKTIKLHAKSNALITHGLTGMMLSVYDRESPQVILRCPPTFLQTLGIIGSLSPNRAAGLQSFYAKLLKIALSLA